MSHMAMQHCLDVARMLKKLSDHMVLNRPHAANYGLRSGRPDPILSGNQGLVDNTSRLDVSIYAT